MEKLEMKEMNQQIYLMGDRIAFTEPFENLLPRCAVIGSTHCAIFPMGHKKCKKSLCNHCYKEGHFRNQCQNPTSWV